jgi:hypothetical protein
MSGDYSRKTFEPRRDFSGVLMQQGRVQLDADWNELVGIISRRLRAETIDIIGRGTVPTETPDGFKIEISGGVLTIGRGRIYVDGLLAENHGKSPLEFDSVLAEQRGTLAVPYNEQPYFPNAATVAPAPTEGGPYLVYLDVWQREVTYLEVPDLIEKAVGVDTTTRLQTVWQVRVLADVGGNVACDTPDDQVPGWLDIIHPSDGRLSTDAVGVVTEEDPCVIPPSGGYRGLENRLYRVEIHDGGTSGTATFKWSRDNASIATSVTAITALDKLTVARAGRDNTLRFSVGDWIEISDDFLEFAQQPGLMCQIKDVDDATQIITLTAALPTGTFPTDPQGNTDPQRHTRIKRWDQNGKVTDTNNNLLVDLDAPGSKGLIPVPAHGTSVVLEDGVQITFDTPTSGTYRVGDFWCFAARTADASVEKLVEAPPRGIHHHFCRLAIVTFPNPPTDCRHMWPPPFGVATEGCDCTICVSAEQHNQGTLTIYQAVDQVRKTGGTICLGPGVFNLVEKPVHLDGAFAVRIRGQGAATVILQPRADAAFIFRNCQWCTLDYLTIQTIAGTTAAPAIRVASSLGLTIERVSILPPAEGQGPLAGISLEPGFLLLTRIRNNIIAAQSGVAFALEEGDETELLLLDIFYCEHNWLLCSDTGIRLGGSSYYTNDMVLAGNFILGTGTAGISVTGLTFFSELEITDNTISPKTGDGIVVGTGGTRISDNRIINLDADAQDGIRLVEGILSLALAPIVVSGNRLQGLQGNGIAIETLLVSAKIEHNVLNTIKGNGVIMLPGSAARSMSVLANELINIANGTTEETRSVELAAIHLRHVFDGAVSDNIISGIGQNAALATVTAGIRADLGLDLRVSDNTIANIAPPTDFNNLAAGVLIVSPLGHVDVAANLIRRQLAPNDDNSPWEAICILGFGSDLAGRFQAKSFTNLSGTGHVNAISSLAASGAEPVRAGVINNTCHGYGRGPLSLVLITGSCRFSDNQYSCASQKVEAVVDVTAEALIAAENRIECGRDVRSLDVKLGNAKALTVLGNIVGGPIIINGAALGGPWQPLNVIGT